MSSSDRAEMNRKQLINHHGFSLVELLIVVALITVLGTIVFPGMQATLEAYRLDSATYLIQGQLMDTKLNAIKRNRTVWLALDLGGRSYQVKSTVPGTATEVDLEGENYLPNGVTFASSSPVDVRFTSMGRPTAAATVTLETASGTPKSISVSASGKIVVN